MRGHELIDMIALSSVYLFLITMAYHTIPLDVRGVKVIFCFSRHDLCDSVIVYVYYYTGCTPYSIKLV